MWAYLSIGLALAAVGLLVALRRARTEADRAEEENQNLAQDRQRLIDFMHLMTEALGEGLSRQELHQRIVHASILCTGALSACIFEQTARNTMRGVAVEGLFPPHRPLNETTQGKLSSRAKFIEQVLKSEEFPITEGAVGRVAQTRKGELIADAAADPRMVKHDDPALAVRSVIVVPLVFRDRFFGVLAVTNPAGENTFFDEADFTLMQSLAEQAALALYNAEFLHLQIEKKQLDLDLSIASGIQQMLLPREHVQFPGLEIDARYQAAQRVGGDLYDVFPLSDNRLGIAVADVSGKGIPASLLMAICRTNHRQIAPRHVSPAAALAELNRALANNIGAGLYITMVYAIVNVSTGQITLARAGHELPLLARRDDTGLWRTEYLSSEGMALGLVPDEVFGEIVRDQTVAFAPGDTLVLYTDGVTEAPNEEGKEFSGARLADVVRGLATRPPKEINDGILEHIARFTGEGGQRDDFTLVTVRRS